MILFTCYPKSQSRQLCTFLKAHKMKVEHEILGEDGTVSWIHAGKGKIFTKYIEETKYDSVIHFIENPLVSIPRTAEALQVSLNYLITNIGKDLDFKVDYAKKNDKIKVAMWCWIHWIEKLEKMSSYTFNISDLKKEEEYNKLMEQIGITPDFDLFSSFTWLSVPLITWEKLEKIDSVLANQIKIKSEKYGFKEPIKKEKIKLIQLNYTSWSIDEKEEEWIRKVIESEKIKSVVEFGAGESTKLFASAVNQVLSFESDSKFAEKLTKFSNVDIIVGSLHKEIEIPDSKFDLAFVDGPPAMGVTKGKARFHPTVAAIQLSDRVMIHDTKRIGEQNTIAELFENEQWVRSECPNSKRGLTLFTKVM